MARGLPNSRLVVLDNSGHFTFVEENFMFTEWVRQFMSATGGLESDIGGTQPIRSLAARAAGR
jgi:hypothetical protein